MAVFDFGNTPDKCQEVCHEDILGLVCEPRAHLAAAICSTFVDEQYNKYKKVPPFKEYFNQYKAFHQQFQQTTTLKIIGFIISFVCFIVIIIRPISVIIKICCGHWIYFIRFFLAGLLFLLVFLGAQKMGII